MNACALLRRLSASFVAPQSCVFCDSSASSGYPVCDACLEAVLRQETRRFSSVAFAESRCEKCGRPLISAEGLCYTCRTAGVLKSIDRIITLFPYTPAGQELLISWKMRGMRGLSPVFAGLIAECLSAHPALKDLQVVPVPPRPGKLAEKGWDQIEDLCRFLSRDHGVPVLNCLRRSGGIQQKKLGRLARFSNMHGRIDTVSDVAIPSSAIILDDVVTTGSTIDACADALKCAGCEKVYGLTLFYD